MIRLLRRTGQGRAAGFTLIELLVVISIISLLVAILLPALSKARGAAYDAQCLSTIRQLSIASLNYSVDESDYLVPWVDHNDIGASFYNRGVSDYVSRLYSGAMWMDTLWSRYLNKNMRAMECPLQETKRPTAGATYNYYDGSKYEVGIPYPGYMITRMVVVEEETSGRFWMPRRLDEFDRPAQKILHGDSGLNWDNASGVGLKEAWGPVSAINATYSQGSTSGVGLSGRHKRGGDMHDLATTTDESGGSNIAFFDGHAGYGNWIEMQPWLSSNANPQNRSGYNQGYDIFQKYWDPDGDGNRLTPY